MLHSVLTAGTVSATPTWPLEISGEQTPPEFREGLLRNKNFVLQIWTNVQTLLDTHRLEYPYLYEDQLGLLAESQHLMSVQINRCTQTGFHLEMCLFNLTTVLQQYHSYLTAHIERNHLGKMLQKVEDLRLDLNNLRLNIEELMHFLDVTPEPTGIEVQELNFANDFLEQVAVRRLLKKLKKFMENISRVFNFVLGRM
ncbi:interleukin-6-like isoform X2 [Stegostoma tigrinum]|nr:interleukin-6-like isoform X2 [Stegostoma tigrinum]